MNNKIVIGFMALAFATGADAPATLTKVNLVATEVGGGIEEITDFVGPGLTGRRLLDGRADPAWRLDWYAEIGVERAQGESFRGVHGPNEKPPRLDGPVFPVEIVFSFFDRQPALVGAVTIVLPAGEALLPKDVEVWTSLENVADKYEKAAERSLTALPAEQTISFPAREARYVKLLVLSATSESDFQMAEVRVLESVRAGYVPLFSRARNVKHWKGSPRDAAQRGLEWLQQASVNWWDYHQCFGCHVQGQVVIGQEIAQRNGYRVNMPALRLLVQSARVNTWETPAGWAYASMALTRANSLTGTETDPAMQEQLAPLLKSQTKAGYFADPRPHLPIIHGGFDVTGNALVALDWASSHGGDARIKPAAARALAWMIANVPLTTQAKVYKIISLARFAPDKRDMMWALVDKLTSEQQPDGGWKETAAMMGSNAFATG